MFHPLIAGPARLRIRVLNRTLNKLYFILSYLTSLTILGTELRRSETQFLFFFTTGTVIITAVIVIVAVNVVVVVVVKMQ